MNHLHPITLTHKTLWERVSPIALNLLKETMTMKRNLPLKQGLKKNFRKNAKKRLVWVILLSSSTSQRRDR